jgi:hypothetical protein
VHIGVEHLWTSSAVAAFDDPNGVLMANCLMVRAVVAQGVINVADCDDTGLEGDLLSGEPMRVSAPVPVLVVLECDNRSQTQDRVLAWGQNGMAPQRMLPHNRPLIVVQRAPLLKMLRRNEDLSNVVKDRRRRQLGRMGLSEAHMQCHNFGQCADPALMQFNPKAHCLAEGGIGERTWIAGKRH